MSSAAARLTAPARNQRGVALFAAIAGMVLLSTMIAALVILARNESLIAQLNKDEAQAAYAAEAGANWGRRLLQQRLSVDLPAAVSAQARSAMSSYLAPMNNCYNCGAQFIRDYAVPASGPTFQTCSAGCAEPNYSAVGTIPDAQQTVMTITCPGTAGCPTGLSFTTRVIVGTHPTIPPAITNGGLGAVFTYVWRIESSGTAGRARQQWVIHDSSVPSNTAGSFKIALNAEFVKYAHFIDQFQDAGSGDPWMSFRHTYTGPVHTNTRFSILGDITTPGNEGPVLKSEATQTMTTTRFNNAGSAQNLSRDSSSKDWPLLGPDPGILCKSVDCSGFTRGYDYDPTTGTIDPIPFPTTGTLGGSDDARKLEVCVALGYTGTANGRLACPATVTTGTMPLGNTRDTNCGGVPVIVDGNCGTTGLTLLGGVYIWPGTAGTLLPTSGGVPYVTDLQLANTADGQTLIIYTWTGAGGTTNPNRRVIIEEKRSTNQTIVTRQCLKTGTPTDTSACTTSTGGTWYLDTSSTARNGAINQQVFSGLFSRYAGDGLTPTVTAPLDYGVIYVYNADVGQVSTSNGLRRGYFSTTGCTPRQAGAGGTKDCHTTGWVDPSYAIYQNTGATAANKADGVRLTLAADGNIWITGALNYRVDPRGTDGFFSDPIPGDPTGTSADDQLDAQGVLGVVSWSTPLAWVPTTRSGGIRLSSALTGDLPIHAMLFVANLSGNGEPSGQFSFDDPNGTYRGISTVLGGVVQKTMGTFGQPSSNLGYARDWVYDERFRYRALSPPAFPGFPNFTAATSLGIDSYSWRLGIFQ
jgi:Tfp pilus assembly protein PilX